MFSTDFVACKFVFKFAWADSCKAPVTGIGSRTAVPTAASTSSVAGHSATLPATTRAVGATTGPSSSAREHPDCRDHCCSG